MSIVHPNNIPMNTEKDNPWQKELIMLVDRLGFQSADFAKWDWENVGSKMTAREWADIVYRCAIDNEKFAREQEKYLFSTNK